MRFSLERKESKMVCRTRKRNVGDSTTRKVKDRYTCDANNSDALNVNLGELREDKRTKEQVCWKEKSDASIRFGKIREKEDAYIEVEKYVEKTHWQDNELQQILECEKDGETHMIKYRKLRDISNIVRKTERGGKLIFGKQFIEEMVKPKEEKVVIKAREMKELKRKAKIEIECKR